MHANWSKGNDASTTRLQVILYATGFVVVLSAAVYLMLLGAGALLRPARAKRFLASFASSASMHFVELALRLVVGSALVITAPRMGFGSVFSVFGWVLVWTTLALAAVPWRLHHRFARWSVPKATQYMPLLGISSLLAGLLLLAALVLPHVSS
jgi:hypothetical protein